MKLACSAALLRGASERPDRPILGSLRFRMPAMKHTIVRPQLVVDKPLGGVSSHNDDGVVSKVYIF
jgi:hypothetical protein